MSRTTWPFGLVIVAAACTAPPRVEVAPVSASAPAVRLQIGLDAPDLDAAALDAAALHPLESALADVAAVTAVAARIDDGHAEVIATLTTPAAIDAVRAALERARLPAIVGSPRLTRLSDLTPVLTLALPADGSDGAVRTALERTPGVARVDTCGGHEPLITVELDRTRLADIPLDRLIEAVHSAAHLDTSDPLPERLAATAIAGTRHTLHDLASVRDDRRLRPCAARTARGPVVLLSVFAHPDADPRKVAVDARVGAVSLVSPTLEFFADPLPTADAPSLAVLALELARTDLAATDLADCLAAGPGLPPWALTFPDPSTPERATLLLATPDTFPIGHAPKDMSHCTTVKRVGVLAPRADADHALGVRILGPDPIALAAIADLAAERLASVPGVTHLRVLAPRERPPSFRLDRQALAARGIAVDLAARVLHLAVAPLPLTTATGRTIELDLPDRTGSLENLHIGSVAGLVPLAELVLPAQPQYAPRYRLDRVPAAAIDLRLRRASDREAVQDALQGLILPTGLRLELGPELSFLGP